MRITFEIWMQDGPSDAGRLVTHTVDEVEPDMSLLEALDHVNAGRIARGERVVEFDHDCREGICGTCGLVVDGRAHGPHEGTTTCQLYLRSFHDGARIVVEPFRSAAFPVVRDLKVDRSALDRVARAGGFVSTHIRTAPEANSIPIARADAEASFAAAACIGCGACVASCKNSAASLFTAAKIEHLGRLPQGRVESTERVLDMVAAMDDEGFGHCTNTEACEAVCPQAISTDVIASLNRRYLWARLETLGRRRV